MARLNNKQASCARPKPTLYHCSGFDIRLVPANPDNQKWHATKGDVDVGCHPTVGAAIRAIRAHRLALRRG